MTPSCTLFSREEQPKPRMLQQGCGLSQNLSGGITYKMLEKGVAEAYSVLDTIDSTLLKAGGTRLSGVVELANLSSILGNIIAQGVVNNSSGAFKRAGPHKYQDLRPATKSAVPIEIKVALETNRPKGHLAKPGHYLSVRYVLGNEVGNFVRKSRGDVVWIWELRLGHIDMNDFAISDTPGDSGKTAVVTTGGMKKLKQVYFDPDFCPYKNVKRYLRDYG